jgi:multiple sugar transport system ATP-binding protein
VGSEKIVHIRSGEKYTLIARLDPHADIKTGETVEFVANMNLSHVFDRETEEIVF